MKKLFHALALTLAAATFCHAVDADLDVPISHFQVIGSHNSYHIAPMETELEFIRLRGEAEAESLAYTHPPLPQQFEGGIRQIELDCFPDPTGGTYALPAALQLAKLARKPVTPQPDPEGLMAQPGTKILHFPNFDFRTTVLTLTQALTQTRDWSQNNPKHFPILVLLELKGSAQGWDNAALQALEKEILATLPREHLLTPDDVRGSHPDLRTAILTDGWPTLREAQGKLILALDNTGAVRTNYLAPDPLLKGRLLFPSAPSSDHPSAGWFKLNNPVADFAKIKALSAQGFLIRTRADAGTTEARQNNPTRKNKALASGAQFISTDFPVANPAFSDYAVTLPEGQQEYFRFRK